MRREAEAEALMSDYTLDYGTHASAADGRCAMEWVSYLAGEPHSDEPACVSPVLRAVCIALNDGLDHEPRQRLRPYLARTIGTAGDGLDPLRGWMALDWLIREYTPCWLRAAGLERPAQQLSELPPVGDEASLRRSLIPLARGQSAARASRCALPWSPARSVARDIAWSFAAAAAWAGARLAVGDLAGDRARAAARTIAADAAAAAAMTSLRDQPPPSGRAAIKDAARTALAPTVNQLQTSVFALLERMLPTEAVVIPAPQAALFTRSV
jgi:hypothetical protein